VWPRRVYLPRYWILYWYQSDPKEWIPLQKSVLTERISHGSCIGQLMNFAGCQLWKSQLSKVSNRRPVGGATLRALSEGAPESGEHPTVQRAPFTWTWSNIFHLFEQWQHYQRISMYQFDFLVSKFWWKCNQP